MSRFPNVEPPEYEGQRARPITKRLPDTLARMKEQAHRKRRKGQVRANRGGKRHRVVKR